MTQGSAADAEASQTESLRPSWAGYAPPAGPGTARARSHLSPTTRPLPLALHPQWAQACCMSHVLWDSADFQGEPWRCHSASPPVLTPRRDTPGSGR